MTTLAIALMTVSRKARGLESAADNMLTNAKRFKTLADWNEAVRAAYVENSWSQTQGRPSARSKLKPAPDVVKMYVTTVRKALQLGLALDEFTSMRALRDRTLVLGTVHALSPEPRPELVGVVLRSPHKLTGALWHDVVTLADEMPEERAREMEEEVRAVYEKYRQYAPTELLEAEQAA
jgi:hypothetical protein